VRHLARVEHEEVDRVEALETKRLGTVSHLDDHARTGTGEQFLAELSLAGRQPFDVARGPDLEPPSSAAVKALGSVSRPVIAPPRSSTSFRSGSLSERAFQPGSRRSSRKQSAVPVS